MMEVDSPDLFLRDGVLLKRTHRVESTASFHPMEIENTLFVRCLGHSVNSPPLSGYFLRVFYCAAITLP